ncbi:MAG TPA: family 10 glycosylhydrolase, partial [Balneolaceae bacterium]|nr:family 10 glycosylhydrolase [Balneolaceae bacterium]
MSIFPVSFLRYLLPGVYLVLFITADLAAGCGLAGKALAKNPSDSAHAVIKPGHPINPDNIPKTPREMRGVWIATVKNMDWPSKPGLPVARQKAELRAMLNKAAKLKMNTVFFQVRPAADAFYKSPYEPWSYFLTGKQGRPPQPYYDPLKFAIKEAHRRGLRLQAWFNPFRAYHPAEPKHFAPKSIINTHPGWVVKYGPYYWINPGIKAARRYVIKVILDVAKRYNIDGIHLDDYFYPYPRKNSNGQKIPFPDGKTYRKYVKKHGQIKRGNWRRQNIDDFVKQLHDTLNKADPKISFGISPFGIWQPGHPAQIKGYNAYAEIYADSRRWLRNGWVDYLAPQLYWSVEKKAQSFPVLLKWWEKQNFFNRHIWPGIHTSKVGKSWSASEIRR